jgi:hypothetical protein
MQSGTQSRFQYWTHQGKKQQFICNYYRVIKKSLCTWRWQQSTQLISWRWSSENTFGMWTVLYWTRSSRTQLGVSINVWRLAGDTLNNTCIFQYCNHQVHRDFLITLYFLKVSSKRALSQWNIYPNFYQVLQFIYGILYRGKARQSNH